MSIYLSVCLFYYILFFRFCSKISDKTEFVVLCFLLRTTSAIGGAASETSAMSIVIEQFPNNVAAVTVCTMHFLFSLTRVSSVVQVVYNMLSFPYTFLLTDKGAIYIIIVSLRPSNWIDELLL